MEYNDLESALNRVAELEGRLSVLHQATKKIEESRDRLREELKEREERAQRLEGAEVEDALAIACDVIQRKLGIELCYDDGWYLEGELNIADPLVTPLLEKLETQKNWAERTARLHKADMERARADAERAKGDLFTFVGYALLTTSAGGFVYAVTNHVINYLIS